MTSNLDELLEIFFNQYKQCNAIQLQNKLLQNFAISLSKAEAEAYLKLVKREYLNDNGLVTAEAVLNKLLIKNELAEKYLQDDLYACFRGTLIEAVERNELGGWSIEKQLVEFIQARVPAGASIIEFGSGLGTEALLYNYRVTSVEHNEKYAYQRTGQHLCIYAPLKDGWYDRSALSEVLQLSFDLLLIDGPPGELRGGILKNMDLFTEVEMPIIFDDINREFDREVMIEFCARQDYRYNVHGGEKKSFADCFKK